jgi:hypothetical protein
MRKAMASATSSGLPILPTGVLAALSLVGHLSGHKCIDHPVAGLTLLERASFAVSGAEGLRLAVYTPVAEGDTERKLAGLVREAA